MTLPIYCLSVEMHPWYDPAPRLLANLSFHIRWRHAPRLHWALWQDFRPR